MKNALVCQITNKPRPTTAHLTELVKKVNRTLYRFFGLKAYAYYDLTFINSKTKMQQLNRAYRHKNYATDVISVCLWDQKEVTTPLLGEIFIYLPQIKKQAKHYKTSYEYEFVRMLVHSILHLFGFHHENDCFVDQYVDCIQTKLAMKVCAKIKQGK